eukprot:150641_1
MVIMSAWLKCIKKIIIIWFVTINLICLLLSMNLMYYNHILNESKALPEIIKLSNEAKQNCITFLDKRFVETPKVWVRFFENEYNLLIHDIYWAQFYEDYYSNMLVKFMKSKHEKK